MNKYLPLALNNKDIGVIPLEIPTPFPVGPVNLYLLFGEKITLVDTGPKTNLAWKSLIYQLNKNGLRIKDIDQVLITHHHVDHCGLLSILLEQHPKINVLTHQLTAPWVEKKPKTLEYMESFFQDLYLQNGLPLEFVREVKKSHDYFQQFVDPVDVNDILSDNDVLPGNSDWRIIHNPGHSQGHISLYHEKTKTLIAGDHLIEHTSSGTFIDPPMNSNTARPKSLVDYKKSLERIKQLDVKQVFSGHGKVITNPNEVIDSQISRFEQRVDRVANYLNGKPITVYELMQRIYPERYERNILLYFSEILGAVDFLEEQGVVITVLEDGLIKYILKQ